MLSATELAVDEPTPYKCGSRIVVFVLPEKTTFFNMAVIENDLYPKVGKCTITVQWLRDKWAEHASM